MPITLNIPANGAITRSGRIGSIIRQLATLSTVRIGQKTVKASVSYKNSTREFEIRAAKRDFCDVVAEAINKAMDDFVKGKAVPHTASDKTATQKVERPSTVYRMPPQADRHHSLALQKKFGEIGRYVGGGCYLQVSQDGRQVSITARDSRSVNLANARLQDTMTAILHPKKSRRATRKPSNKDVAPPVGVGGRFAELVEDTGVETSPIKAPTTAAKLQVELDDWAQGAMLTRGRDSRGFNRLMHETRTKVAEKAGVDVWTVSDRAVHQALRQPTKDDTTPETDVQPMLMMVKKPLTTASAKTNKWSQIVAAPPPVSALTAGKKMSQPFYSTGVQGSAWGDSEDEDEDEHKEHFRNAGAFDDEDAVACSA